MTPELPQVTAMMTLYGEFIDGNSYREDRDIGPLYKAAVAVLRTAPEVPISRWAPAMAVCWFANIEYESKWSNRARVRLMIGVMKVIFYGRAMWNDYYMVLWQLSRDPRYIGRLYQHLKKGNLVQKGTGEWMVGSVCQQDADFAEHWGDLIRERGEVFNGDRERWLSEAR